MTRSLQPWTKSSSAYLHKPRTCTKGKEEGRVLARKRDHRNRVGGERRWAEQEYIHGTHTKLSKIQPLKNHNTEGRIAECFCFGNGRNQFLFLLHLFLCKVQITALVNFSSALRWTKINFKHFVGSVIWVSTHNIAPQVQASAGSAFLFVLTFNDLHNNVLN